MRLGIFSDTHANYEALSAVLESYKKERIDIFYCLGDTVGYGGSPNECVDVIRRLARVTILGNHDAAVAGRMDYSYYYEAARHALDTHAAMLTSENMSWLKQLPYREKLVEFGVDLCHGSPVRIEEFEYIFAPEQARECLPYYGELEHLTQVRVADHREVAELAVVRQALARLLGREDVFELLEAHRRAVAEEHLVLLEHALIRKRLQPGHVLGGDHAGVRVERVARGLVIIRVIHAP